MKIDLHLHSEFSWDSSVSISDYISKAEQMDFSAISITDHNNTDSHDVIRDLQSQTSVLLIPGQEVSTRDGHLLVYGWLPSIKSQLSMQETVQFAVEKGGYCIAAHPFDKFRSGKGTKIFESNILGFEILNASSWLGYPNWKAKKVFKSHPSYVGVANSDAHRLEEFGSAYTILDPDGNPTIESVFDGLSVARIGGHRIGIVRKLYRFFLRTIS